MDIVAERIRKAMKLRNKRQIDIIQETGINKGSLSSYLSGKYSPKQTNIYLLAKALQVNEAWLMGHDVPMEVMNNHFTKNNLVKETKSYHTQNEAKLLHYFQMLNKNGQTEALKRIQEMTYIDTYKIEN